MQGTYISVPTCKFPNEASKLKGASADGTVALSFKEYLYVPNSWQRIDRLASIPDSAVGNNGRYSTCWRNHTHTHQNINLPLFIKVSGYANEFLTSKTPSELPVMVPTGLTRMQGLSQSHHLSGKVILASFGKGLSNVMSLRVVCLAGASIC